MEKERTTVELTETAKDNCFTDCEINGGVKVAGSGNQFVRTRIHKFKREHPFFYWLSVLAAIITVLIALNSFFAKDAYVGFFYPDSSAKGVRSGAVSELPVSNDRLASPEEATITERNAILISNMHYDVQLYLMRHPNASPIVRLYDTQEFGLIWTIAYSDSDGWFDIFVDANTGEIKQIRGPFHPLI